MLKEKAMFILTCIFFATILANSVNADIIFYPKSLTLRCPQAPPAGGSALLREVSHQIEEQKGKEKQFGDGGLGETFRNYTPVVGLPLTSDKKWPEEGDWIIDGEVSCISKNITLNGNLIIVDGGKLILEDSTLFFNSKDKEGYLLEVKPGGSLIVDSSTITGPEDKYYSISIHADAEFSLVNSAIKNAGWKDQKGTSEYLYIGSKFTRDYSTLGHGVEMHTTPLLFKNNIFENIASIRFYASNNLVENNVIKEIRHEGFAFMSGSDNNIVRNNRILGAAEPHRETHGIRFYPGTKNNEIYNNTINRVAYGIMIGQIPPWSVNRNFKIHHNTIRECFRGLWVGELRDSHIHNEDYKLVSLGMGFANSPNVLVENSSITNITYVIPEIMTPEYFEEVKEIIHPKYPRTWFDFTLRKGGVMINWAARNLTIKNNRIAYAPPFGYGIQFDVKYTAHDVKIVGNTIEHIGDDYYIPLEYIKRPFIASVGIRGLPRRSGGAIEVESSHNLVIKNNTVRNSVNGIVTDFPDAIGNNGDLLIENNLITGISNEVPEIRGRVEKDVGIAVGTRIHSPGENEERKALYETETEIRIVGNTISNFYYGLAVDIDRPELKSISVSGNRFLGYEGNIVPDYIDLEEDNELMQKPDLELRSIIVSKNEEYEINVIIANLGGDARNVTVSLEVNQDEVGSKAISFLKSGETTTLTFPWTPIPGSHNLTAVVDSDERIDELDEDNNVKSMIVSVEMPDMELRSIIVSKNEEYEINVIIANLGGDAKDINVSLQINKSEIDSKIIPLLRSNETTVLEFLWVPVSGAHNLTVAIDPNEIIEEINEDNNVKSMIVYVEPEKVPEKERNFIILILAITLGLLLLINNLILLIKAKKISK
jgi:hypothetical protein